MVYLNTAQEFWDIEDENFAEVTVPEWKINGEAVTVRLRALSGSERDRYEQSCQRMKNGVVIPDAVNARARLVAWSAVDEHGKKIFKGEAEMLRLGMKNARALNRLFEAACELSGLTDADQEELLEGFSNGQSEPSTSD